MDGPGRVGDGGAAPRAALGGLLMDGRARDCNKATLGWTLPKWTTLVNFFSGPRRQGIFFFFWPKETGLFFFPHAQGDRAFFFFFHAQGDRALFYFFLMPKETGLFFFFF